MYVCDKIMYLSRELWGSIIIWTTVAFFWDVKLPLPFLSLCYD